MTQVPASSHGGGLPLTGGTVTGPIIVDASAGLANGVKVISADAGSASIRVTDAVSLADLFKVNTDGDVTIQGIAGITASSGSLIITSSNDSVPTSMLRVVDSFHSQNLFTVAGSGLVSIPSGGLATAPPVPATQVFVSGAGAQLSTTRDVRAVTPVTFNPGAATTATVAVAISPDGATYTTLWTETEPAGVAFDGTVHGINVYVPAAWYLRLTVNAQAVLGTTTYY